MTNPKSRKKGKTLQPKKVDKKGPALLPAENVTFYSAQRIDLKFDPRQLRIGSRRGKIMVFLFRDDE